MEAWYKIATPREEVREGRSFNPDEFAIHLEQFFARTCSTRALPEHAGMVLPPGNALSALYPKGSEEKRLLDAMLLTVPR